MFAKRTAEVAGCLGLEKDEVIRACLQALRNSGINATGVVAVHGLRDHVVRVKVGRLKQAVREALEEAYREWQRVD